MGLKPKTEKVRSRNQAFKDMVKDLEVEKLAAKWAVEDYNEHYFNGEKSYSPEVNDVVEYDDIDETDFYLD